jgi:hypothetical protein
VEEPGKQDVIKVTESGTVGNKALCLQKAKYTFFKACSFRTPTLVPPFSALQEHLSNSALGIDHRRCVTMCSIVSTSSYLSIINFSFKIRERKEITGNLCRWVRNLPLTCNIVFPHNLSFVDGSIFTDNLQPFTTQSIMGILQ